MSAVVALNKYKARVSMLLKNGNHVVEDRFYLRVSPFKAMEACEDDVRACGDRLVSVQVYTCGPNGGWFMVPCVTKGNPKATEPTTPYVPPPVRPSLLSIMATADWTWSCEVGTPVTFPTLKPKTSHVLTGEEK